MNDNIQIIANLATALTFGIAAWQLWEANKQSRKGAIQKRSEYVINLFNTFINDQQMIDIYYQIEYSTFEYDENFHGSENERNLDKLLGHFTNVGRLYESNILEESDLSFLQYEFIIIYENPGVQAYLHFLDSWFQTRGIKSKKFEQFRSTAKKLIKQNRK